MTNRHIMLFGTDEPPASTAVLAAGQLQVTLEAGALRSVTWQGLEVVRGVAFLVRDQSWETLVPEISEEEVKTSPTDFVVTYRASISDRRCPIEWQGKIEGSASGELRFTVIASAL